MGVYQPGHGLLGAAQSLGGAFGDYALALDRVAGEVKAHGVTITPISRPAIQVRPCRATTCTAWSWAQVS